jgi:23S rRNA pseudouridine955/2504/2580 synthase
MAQLGNPIIGDPRYFNIENWTAPEELGQGLHLHARRISLPLPGKNRLDVTAPLPPHMLQTFDALGFDSERFDAQDGDPEDE